MVARIVIVGNDKSLTEALASLSVEQKAFYLQHETLHRELLDEQTRIALDRREAWATLSNEQIDEFFVRESKYAIHETIKVDLEEDLPLDAKKPKFLLQQNHHIRKVRR